MKARFEVPELEVVRLGADDIITGSGGGCSPECLHEAGGTGGTGGTGSQGGGK